MAASADPSPPPSDAQMAVPMLLAGFDAGQTHTTCRLSEPGQPTVLAEGSGPGVRHLAAPGGPEAFRAALLGSLAAARDALAAPWAAAPLAAVAVGASGIEVGTEVQRQGQRLAAAALRLPKGRVAVTGDERTALQGAFAGGAGIVVISGTGTIAVGRDGHGREHRCAGWGWLLDGAGSAMDIGRDALSLSLRMADGRERPGPLLAAIWQALGLEVADPASPQRIKALVVQPDFGAAGFASLAPVVDQVAERGDPQAVAILERNAGALTAMAAAVATALALREQEVCAMGGALGHLAGLRHRFAAGLAERLPGSALVPPRGDACQGALRLAAGLLATRARP